MNYFTRFLLFLACVTTVTPCYYQSTNCQCLFNGFALYVSCKNVERIPEVDADSNITYVYSLNFFDGQITSVHGKSLPPGLTLLGFYNNPLTNLSDDAFEDVDVDSLYQLTISGAAFTQLPRALLKVRTLRSLILQNTNIETWDSTVIQYLGRSIYNLYLENVGLSSSKMSDILYNLSPLYIKELGLGYNKITEITESNFLNMSTLDKLDLSYNPITVISPSAFGSLVSLTIISLSGTRLTEVPLALTSLHDLHSLSMYNMSLLQCPCPSLPDLLKWYRSNSRYAFGDCGYVTVNDYLYDGCQNSTTSEGDNASSSLKPIVFFVFVCLLMFLALYFSDIS